MPVTINLTVCHLWILGLVENGLTHSVFSVYYSRQTDLSTSYWNKNYIDPYGYGYNGYYGYNDYYGNNYDYSYALDPSKSLQMFGVAVGFGKRLNWRMTIFTLSAELGYQLYKLKDWEYLLFYAERYVPQYYLEFDIGSKFYR